MAVKLKGLRTSVITTEKVDPAEMMLGMLVMVQTLLLIVHPTVVAVDDWNIEQVELLWAAVALGKVTIILALAYRSTGWMRDMVQVDSYALVLDDLEKVLELKALGVVML